MHTEFRKSLIPQEIRSLMAFDRKVFPKSDLFPADYWRLCESYWMIIGDEKAGCCAFQPHVDFREDIEESNVWRDGSLYIASTGVLPRLQGLGFGGLLKSWQVAFARFHGFSRIVTNTRSGNDAMIALNRKFGFRILRTTPGYYDGPKDATVVMELRLTR